MFNPAIIIAIIIQAIVSRISMLAGAIVGYLITTGILIWGITVYNDGDQIAFFGIGLSLPVFIVICLVWYGFDTWEFLKVKTAVKFAKERNEALAAAMQNPIMKDDNVRRFYQTTLDTWASGQLDKVNKDFKKEAKKAKTVETFMAGYAPFAGGSMQIFLTNYKPQPGEYLIGQGDLDSAEEPGWFLLTNQRLLQRTGNLFDFNIFNLADIANFKSTTGKTITLTLNMKNGESLEYKDLLMVPQDLVFKNLIAQASVGT